MAAGDAQRVWFPEMLEQLGRLGRETFAWEVMIAFCSKMTSFRVELREAKGIRDPIYYCKNCGKKQSAKLPGVSIRSALFALLKQGIISDSELKSLDRDWARYRRKNRLDAYGNPKESQEAPNAEDHHCNKNKDHSLPTDDVV